MTAHAIPTYALYGETAADAGADWLHCETIQSRSSLHGYRIEPHRHEALFQILHLKSGRAEFTIDGHDHALDGPFILTLPRMVVHGYTFSRDVEGNVLTLFEDRLDDILGAAPEAIEIFRATRIVPLGSTRLSRAVAAEIAAIATEFAGHESGRLGIIEARIALVLIELHRHLAPLGKAGQTGNQKALLHLRQFRQLVDREYLSHLPMAGYARRLNLTAAHLNRLCRQHLGASALEIVHRRLLLEAKRHLTFTTMSAKEVALSLAFEDPAYFVRFFKRRTGLTPMEYRALHRGR